MDYAAQCTNHVYKTCLCIKCLYAHRTYGDVLEFTRGLEAVLRVYVPCIMRRNIDT